ncbi:MAG: hypothetical protein NXI30_08825 [bacterium]|nr:hypothetical protein [bacterium]
MKGAIASVELFAAEAAEAANAADGADSAEAAGARTRLTLTLSAPERASDGGAWVCRVALANLHRPIEVAGPDSVTALASALAQARAWLAELRAQGKTLFRDRTGESAFELG